MIQRMNGRIDGKRIDLERETGLPAGTTVSVQIEPQSLASEQGSEGIMASFGVWKDDEEIAQIFDEILREREHRPCRDVTFDASR